MSAALVAMLVGLALAALGLRRLLAGYPPVEGLATLARREAATLDAAGLAMYPPGGAIPPSGREAGIVTYVDGYVGAMPGRGRLLLRALFLLVEHATLVLPAPGARGRRRFSSLDARQRVAVLERLARSRLPAARLVFQSLRAVLTLAYLGSPAVARALGVAPYALDTPVVEADLLFPRVGAAARTRPTRRDLTPESDGRPIPLDAPLHPAYRACRVARPPSS